MSSLTNLNREFWLALAMGAVITLLGLAADAFGQAPPGQRCPPGQQCEGVSCRLSIQGWHAPSRIQWPAQRQRPAATMSRSCVVPVYFGSDPIPGAGIYIGTIRGRGVTLTCWHAAQHGVRAVGRADVTGVTRDKFGYDMAAVFTRPLDVPRGILSRITVRIGDTVRLVGYATGRSLTRIGQVLGWCLPGARQRHGDLRLNVRSSSGDSGGAIFNEQGHIIGLLWGTRSDGSADTAAVPHPAIADFLARVEVMLAKEDGDPGPAIVTPEVPIAPPSAVEPEADDPTRLPLVPVVRSTTDLEDLRALIQQNSEAIAALVAVAAVPGPPGPPGPPGESPTINIDDLTAQVLERLPPFYVHSVDDVTGAEKLEAISLGEGFTIRTMTPE